MRRPRTRLTDRGWAVLTIALCVLVFTATLLFTTPTPAPWIH